MDLHNEKLIKKAIKENKNAFEKLIKQHYERIYRTAFLYVHNEEDALDVVQEATFQAFKSIHSLKHPEYFLTWFTRIIIRCSSRILKRNNNNVFVTDEVISNFPERERFDQDESMSLLQAIHQLKHDYRSAIILFYYFDYSIKTISELMEIPEGTAKTFLRRGKAELKKIYKNEEGYYG